jgi:hypothetical protein
MDIDANVPLVKTDSAGTDPILDEHAAEICRLGRRAVEDVIEIGRRLTVCKEIVDHGGWLSWLNLEFGAARGRRPEMKPGARMHPAFCLNSGSDPPNSE